MKCMICQHDAPGAFCQNCGAPVDGATCPECETTLLPGANFCTSCGLRVRQPASRLPLYLAGTAIVALSAVLIFSGQRSGPTSGPGLPPELSGGAPAMTGGPGPLTGTPREQADQLFNRVMQPDAMGDVEQVAFFVPMAVLAYQQAGELDNDGLYHLSLLETLAGDPVNGLESARRILDRAPDHFLALGAAARAAAAMDDETSAAGYYERLLQVHDAERGKTLPEYVEHAQIFGVYKEEATAFLGRD